MPIYKPRGMPFWLAERAPDSLGGGALATDAPWEPSSLQRGMLALLGTTEPMSFAGLAAAFPGTDIEGDLEQLIRMGKLRRTGDSSQLVTTERIALGYPAMSAIPTKVRKAVRFRDFDRCVSCSSGSASDIHHRMRRREGGHALSVIILLCRTCHEKAHANPTWARERGIIVPTWRVPQAVPLKIVEGLDSFSTTKAVLSG